MVSFLYCLARSSNIDVKPNFYLPCCDWGGTLGVPGSFAAGKATIFPVGVFICNVSVIPHMPSPFFMCENQDVECFAVKQRSLNFL